MMQFISNFLLLVLGMAALVGCGVPGAPKPPSLELPEPVADLRAVRKGDRVFLDWTMPPETTDHLAVRHLGSTRICRSLNAVIKDCANPVAEVSAPQLPRRSAQSSKSGEPAPKMQAAYVDNLPRTLLVEDSHARIFYAISVLNTNGRSAGISNIVQVPAVAAVPPPSDFRAQVTAGGVVLSWTAVSPPRETSGLRRAYRVYRRLEGGDTDTVAGEVPLDITKLADHNFEWEKTYLYRTTVVTRIEEKGMESEVEGDDTPVVRVFAHDIFPPAVPSGLQAVFSGSSQRPFIDLIWAPDTDADLAGYNVFRHEAGAEPVKIDSELVKTPAFRDMNVAPGKTYFYSVSAIDVRANESARSQEASEEVP